MTGPAQSCSAGRFNNLVVQLCVAAAPLKKSPSAVPPPNGQFVGPAGHSWIWFTMKLPPVPRNSGSVLKIVAVSTLPSFERHAVPVDMKMTVVFAFVNPDHGLQKPASGNA